MATYVLIPGGGHGGWCYQKVARLLRAEGHAVYAPSLTGLGERAHLLGPDIDLNTHIRDVTALLHYEDLTDVILAGHSYGGMVITGAADRAASRVGKLVYLDAAVPVNGESLVSRVPSVVGVLRQDSQVINGAEVVLPPSPEAGRRYGVTDPADLAWMAERLTPQPWKCFETPLELTNEAALAAIPEYHIVCTSALAVRSPDRTAKAKTLGRLWDIDTGHDLMITEPRAVADALLEIAAERTG